MEIKNIVTKSMGNFLTITNINNKQYCLSKEQRPYKWGKKQILELLDDTYSEFSKYYSEKHNVVKSNYKNYKLDTVIIYNDKIVVDDIRTTKDDILQIDDDTSYADVVCIADGQQRITSMTLLYIYLNKYLTHLRELNKNKENFNDDIIKDLYDKVIKIQKSRHGENKYLVLYVEDRKNCMKDILKSKINNIEEDLEEKDEDTASVKNLKANYSEINEFFKKITDKMREKNDKSIEEVNSDIAHKLGLYARWLMDNVIINVEEVKDADEAFDAFMKKNNRGLSLTPAELIKADCAHNATNYKGRRSNAIFEDFFNNVNVRNIETKTDDQFNAITSVVRSRFVNARDENGKIILPKDIDYSLDNTKIFDKALEDYDAIGQEGLYKGPYGWLLNSIEKKEITYDNIVKEVEHFTNINEKIRKSSNKYWKYAKEANEKKSLYDLLLYSAMDYGDNETIINKKIELISRFIEIAVMMDIAFKRRKGHTNLTRNILGLMIAIRNQPIDKIKKIFAIHFKKYYENIEIENILRENFKQNKKLAKYILARISIELERILSDKDFNEIDLIKRYLRYQLEHILPQTPDNDEFYKNFNDKDDYFKCNDEIGNYILLKESENKKVKNKKYSDKLLVYARSDSKIARSLTEDFYNETISIIGKINKLKETYPELQSYKEFTKSSIEQRTELYISIAKTIWSLDYFN